MSTPRPEWLDKWLEISAFSLSKTGEDELAAYIRSLEAERADAVKRLGKPRCVDCNKSGITNCSHFDSCSGQWIYAFEAERDSLRKQKDELLEASSALVNTMETCHICKATVLMESGPIHCEDCSYDCENHEDPGCPELYDLHLHLKAVIAKVKAEGAATPGPRETQNTACIPTPS